MGYGILLSGDMLDLLQNADPKTKVLMDVSIGSKTFKEITVNPVD